MARNYHLDPGYMTVPEANKMVLTMLRITNQDDKTHYRKILSAAKKGQLGGKKYGTRMYQVRKKDIEEYAINCLQEEQIKLFDIEVVDNLDTIHAQSKLPTIDQKTAGNIHYYLRYLRFHDIISEDTYGEGEKKLIMRLKIKELNLKE
ncbi:hypothetical protein [Halalkalibacter krulwichiae]|uniref:Uncharacterized protein n=1 Tax=Halalkalibacter krulwichiae TaxID=199441 RepID=A0A1X9MKZ5_9BACI|nr:hypothetical protein [Halalkalibacter krulwichiae]ARK32421.1 hypothetical protein BkAM31D_22575 [Halalkalibacter krulwichiae]